MNELLVDGNEVSGSGPIEVRRVFYKSIPTISRYFDPMAAVQVNKQTICWMHLDSVVHHRLITFVLQPIYDLLRVQVIELNDQIRKSSYTFEIVNNKLRIFPTYENTTPGKLWIEWIKTEDRDSANLVQDIVEVLM